MSYLVAGAEGDQPKKPNMSHTYFIWSQALKQPKAEIVFTVLNGFLCPSCVIPKDVVGLREHPTKFKDVWDG